MECLKIKIKSKSGLYCQRQRRINEILCFLDINCRLDVPDTKTLPIINLRHSFYQTLSFNVTAFPIWLLPSGTVTIQPHFFYYIIDVSFYRVRYTLMYCCVYAADMPAHLYTAVCMQVYRHIYTLLNQ
jgi:hypothetical protein